MCIRDRDRGTHVPLICNQPGKIDRSVKYDLVDSTDFLPTILEAAGINPPKDYIIDGKSFYPQLLGENGTPRDWIFFHFDPLSPRSIISGSPAASKPLIRFVREKRWKLYDDGRLYDLKEDPDEDIPLLSSGDTDNSKKKAIAYYQNIYFSTVISYFQYTNFHWPSIPVSGFL